MLPGRTAARACAASIWVAAGACAREGTIGKLGDDGGTTSATSDGEGSTSMQALDVGVPESECLPRTGQLIPVPCTPPVVIDAFTPIEKWSWAGTDVDTDSYVIPLVVNLTDDDNSGAIDLCDVPDVVVVAGPRLPDNPALADQPAHVYVLDGQRGNVEVASTVAVSPVWTPALGDLDRDDVAEIVTMRDELDDAGARVRRPIALRRDGTELWAGDRAVQTDWYGAIAIADLDHDGAPEIIAGPLVLDSHGLTRATVAASVRGTAPFAVDLERGGELEILYGASAARADGSVLWTTDLDDGYAQVANLDGDDDPEIILAGPDGLSWIDHQGNVLVTSWRTVDLVGEGRRPVAIHDLDSDRRPELLLAIGSRFAAVRADPAGPSFALMWAAPVSAPAYTPGSTAFDFLGDGSAEAMFADEHAVLAFDAMGAVIMQRPRASLGVQDFPVVADIDRDGAAEVLIIGNHAADGTSSPAVQALEDEGDRWVAARRVWNQHTYHVTNVEENGGIPRDEQPVWQRINTFRTNAQIVMGQYCTPEP